MTSTPARDFDPPDEISDWMIATAAALLEARLARDAVTHRLIGATSTQADAFQLLAILARQAGTILRPGGYAGGPVGYTIALAYLAGRGPAGGAHAAVRAATVASQLLGAGARGDAVMVRALAVPVLQGDAGRSNARTVARAMLEVFAREPRTETPQGDQP